MSNTSFQFKKFTIEQDQCAMKVGTDGVLLGAWTPVDGAARILDVGTGTGLIALMLAQRSDAARLVAVEVDAAAARQAQENVDASPWSGRMSVVCQDFREFLTEVPFDLIVSNPPYFTDDMKSPDRQRTLARHAGGLNYDLLFRRATHLLTSGGQVSLIVPSDVEQEVRQAAWLHGFHPLHVTRVYTKSGKPCRRLLMLFGRQEEACRTDELFIECGMQQYSEEYVALTRDFYLRF
ncbi:MAG: methyltransferase [Mediterranea sp.]|nr:methyltransferase [Mediterranea sp.]